MKLLQSNRFLRNPKQARAALWRSAKTSSAVEGIRKPFEAKLGEFQPDSAAALIDYWKRRAAASDR